MKATKYGTMGLSSASKACMALWLPPPWLLTETMIPITRRDHGGVPGCVTQWTWTPPQCPRRGQGYRNPLTASLLSL